jgi:Domain of unknown function (DUF4411)
MGAVVWVIDTNCLIALKRVAIGEQWELFTQLEKMVIDAEIAMPRQVIREASTLLHPDVPGVWAKGVERKLQHPLDVDYELLGEVMEVAGDVIEDRSASDPADPYVLALALQLQRADLSVTVVSDDIVDRLPLKISMATACKRLGLGRVGTEPFLSAIDGPKLPPMATR